MTDNTIIISSSSKEVQDAKALLPDPETYPANIYRLAIKIGNRVHVAEFAKEGFPGFYHWSFVMFCYSWKNVTKK